LERLGAADSALRQRLARISGFEQRGWAPPLVRSPYFCAGCPHNSSTQLPDGSRALAGIGCHGMASFMPERRTHTPTQMGGEGATWIGQAPFVKDTHVFQNLGDGTYTHSGSLAVRAAASSGVNITYKILFNDAVAMTGGQPAEGGLSVAQIAAQMSAEGARRVVVLSEDASRHDVADFPEGVDILDRAALPTVQKQLRDTAGVTVIIYDQTCA
ncbi:MAG: indolepyruvate ferredoxin oxidoreductase family protein, partial [Rhodobacteraceae bacterium]|nr:indolepyruvate ferredoxin oxidoreductase family protein [Paracoccaceae bacterium]